MLKAFQVNDSNRETMIIEHADELVDQMNPDCLRHNAFKAIVRDLQANTNEQLVAELNEYYGLNANDEDFAH